jgi:hypothetical protein
MHENWEEKIPRNSTTPIVEADNSVEEWEWKEGGRGGINIGQFTHTSTSLYGAILWIRTADV